MTFVSELIRGDCEHRSEAYMEYVERGAEKTTKEQPLRIVIINSMGGGHIDASSNILFSYGF